MQTLRRAASLPRRLMGSGLHHGAAPGPPLHPRATVFSRLSSLIGWILRLSVLVALALVVWASVRTVWIAAAQQPERAENTGLRWL